MSPANTPSVDSLGQTATETAATKPDNLANRSAGAEDWEARRLLALERLSASRALWLKPRDPATPGEAGRSASVSTRLTDGSPAEGWLTLGMKKASDWLEDGPLANATAPFASWLRRWWRTSHWGVLARSVESAATEQVLPAMKRNPLPWAFCAAAMAGGWVLARRHTGRRRVKSAASNARMRGSNAALDRSAVSGALGAGAAWASDTWQQMDFGRERRWLAAMVRRQLNRPALQALLVATAAEALTRWTEGRRREPPPTPPKQGPVSTEAGQVAA